MAESQHPLASIEGRGVTIAMEPRFHAASLRYFERDGAFTHMVQSATGLSLPNNLSATHSHASSGADDAQIITLLAWRSPSETTLLTSDEGLLNTLQTSAAEFSDGCVVDQRGGILVFRAQGTGVPSLLAKTAGHGAMPAIGESRRTRLAEVAVLIVKVQAGETLLIVDRMYAPHMMASIRVNAADLDVPLYN
jgi:heterotetrameric sarcosine oxidase gamma subunit